MIGRFDALADIQPIDQLKDTRFDRRIPGRFGKNPAAHLVIAFHWPLRYDRWER